jgi:hypothetical protein
MGLAAAANHDLLLQLFLLLLRLLLLHCHRYDEVKLYTNYANPNMAEFTKWGHFTQVCKRLATWVYNSAAFLLCTAHTAAVLCRMNIVGIWRALRCGQQHWLSVD